MERCGVVRATVFSYIHTIVRPYALIRYLHIRMYVNAACNRTFCNRTRTYVHMHVRRVAHTNAQSYACSLLHLSTQRTLGKRKKRGALLHLSFVTSVYMYICTFMLVLVYRSRRSRRNTTLARIFPLMLRHR
jgi:hypothetical protein